MRPAEPAEPVEPAEAAEPAEAVEPVEPVEPAEAAERAEPARTAAARPTLGRGEKVRTAVLAAALAELAETGYTALTVDGVAQRAGVHKTTVYRRWKDRGTLLVDALAGQIATDIPIPDTGSVDDDLRALARGLAAWLTGPSGSAVLAVLLSDAVRVPAMAEVRARIFGDRLRRAEPVVRRAVERGQLPPGTDPAEVIKNLAAPLYFRVLITAERVGGDTADRAAAAVLAAARNGGLG
ncbi:TetR/AcrR family transcriptional regulator C-terminal ligand-binding domain-containing protein [Kitasatospora sp. NPDC057940]|uniref:TetR/AcrR family transcriptional regulator n=1 Tax=Kitasatospora sp. NPDC057940 TaxID=3346285 RepID=UPI0036D8DC87